MLVIAKETSQGRKERVISANRFLLLHQGPIISGLKRTAEITPAACPVAHAHSQAGSLHTRLP